MRNWSVRYLATFVLLALPLARAQTSKSEAAPPPLATSAESAQTSTPLEMPEQADSVAPQQKATQPEKVLIYARSDTVYMKSATIRSWLQLQPEFGQLSFAFTANQGHADYYVEITRPLFTWDWTYCVVKIKSGKVAGSGKVTAATAERAAEALARKIIQVLYAETSASGRRSAAADTATGVPPGGILPKRFVSYEELTRKFQSARTFSVHSATVWFEPSDLEQALRQRPEFSGWGYVLVSAQQSDGKVVSDLVIEVNRPLFTWDWTFSIQDRSTNNGLASGKVTAISGPAAAPMLAKAIVGTIANSRGLPALMQRQFDQALTETKVRTWKVRHISGQSHLKSGENIELAVGQNTVFAREGDNILFSVPVKDLLQFSYSSSLRDRSVKWFQAWEKAGNAISIGDDPGGIMGGVIIGLSMLAIEHGLGGLLKASTTTDYFLILHWKDESGVTMATFQGSEKDVREICDELHKFSKSPAVDLDGATQKAHSEFEHGLESTSYFLETEQTVTLENKVLLPGKYRVVILQRERNLAEVFFLKAADNVLAARAMVEYAPRSDADRRTRISYGTVSGLQTFEEIQIDEHILRFSSVPIVLEEV